METLFRFNVVREPNRSADEIDPIDLTAATQFQTDAAAIPNGGGRRLALQQLAETYVRTGPFVSDIGGDPVLGPLDKAATAVDDLLEGPGPYTRTALDAALTAALGGDPGTFVGAAGIPALVERLKDSILAVKLSPANHKLPLRRLAALLRAIELCRRFDSDAQFPADRAELVAVQRRGMKLPAAVLPTQPPRPPRPERPPILDRLKGIAEQYQGVAAAYDELVGVRPNGFAVVPQDSIGPRMPDRGLRPEALFAEEVSIRRTALGAVLKASLGEMTRPEAANRITIATSDTVKSAMANFSAANLGVAEPAVPLGKGARIALTGSPGFKPVLPGLVGLRLAEATVGGLSQGTATVLSDLGLDPKQPIARTVEALAAEKQRLHEEAQELVPLTQKSFKTVGGTAVAITSSPMPLVLTYSPIVLLEFCGTVLGGGPSPVPTTSADIEPAGIMDLLLVKQQLKGYEGAEVSHIANILKGEKSDRVHRTRLEMETITLTEREVETTTERSLETTDRFEMRRESEKALQEETSVKGSASLKASYGPTVEFRASVEASWQRKSQEAERAASETARQVTQKASEKVTERVLTRETRRVTREVEEIEQHGFDNTKGTGHISGVYQWVTKVYEAQVFNYGPRTVYDLMLPEPAALLMEAFRSRRSAALELEKPPAFDITPRQLNADNYQTYVSRYGATDVVPPPQPYVTESYDFNTGGEDKDQEFTNSTRVQVPAGYEAIRATVGQVVAVWDDWSVAVVVGQRAHVFTEGNSFVWSSDLDEETGSVPFAMVTDKVGDVAIAVEVICAATKRAHDLWKAETHAKLTQAYRNRLSEYEAKLAELKADAPDEIQSGPSAHNRALMIDEIKRLAISTLTLQHFDAFDAIDTGSGGLPEVAFTEASAEGSYARFFEQAFEWENISWVPYGYFWGRKSTWLDRIVIEDDDADYAAFLKAGYVRVQIPVRPGFAEAVDHFRIFGVPWLGGSLPAVSDDLYLPIADEIAERLGRPGAELPVGETWEVRVPTTLVKLRDDDALPTWTKQPDGSWVEN